MSTDIVDCTFYHEKEAFERLCKVDSRVVGIYSMYTLMDNTLRFAKVLRTKCDVLVVGGPLPTVYPESFVNDFDLVVRGEGEQTMLGIVQDSNPREHCGQIKGVLCHHPHLNTLSPNHEHSDFVAGPPREFVSDIDSLPFPARDLFDNAAYQAYYQKLFGYTVTSLMSSQGCPFRCDFCSKPVFGDVHRARSAKNVVDEIEDALSYGYQRIFF
ncbi:hypothetical protein MUO79_10130 [Candidatus Bathyarchaeota archaeon]|nr:hypothetical protein [Candidatus Bathyarchaeota archaeon]